VFRAGERRFIETFTRWPRRAGTVPRVTDLAPAPEPPTRRLGAPRGRGATVWLTGLPAAGKTTLAAAVRQALVEAGQPAYRIDGDVLREGLNSDLGFDVASRDESVRRAAEVARMFADAGTVAVVALVSPYAAARDAARARHEDDGLAFLEVWVATPLAVCERRDPKGLYSRARRGELVGLTGVDDPYEAPAAPEVIVDGTAPARESAARVLEALAAVEATRC
jgi:adenylyl-sulfate kinase